MATKMVKAGVAAAAAALAAAAAGMFAGTALAETGGSVGDNFGVHCNLSAPIQVGVLLGLTGDNYSCNTPTVPTVPGSLPGGV